jgi:UDP-2,3-diacylglucosamine hydrolase
MKAFFVSDIHLTQSDDERAQKFLGFLRFLMTETEVNRIDKPTHLFLVGDIFDLWVGSHNYFRQKFEPIIDHIRKLVRKGVEVHFFEGNHDLYLSEFWQGEVGVTVHENAEIFVLGGLKVRVEHGDLINPDDRGYLFLRALLHSQVVSSLAKNLPSRIVAAIGERASRASRSYTSSISSKGSKALPEEKIRSLIHAHAERVAAEVPFDLLISGHVHVRDDLILELSDARRIRTVNLGSWFDEPQAFVLRDGGHGQFEKITSEPEKNSI